SAIQRHLQRCPRSGGRAEECQWKWRSGDDDVDVRLVATELHLRVSVDVRKGRRDHGCLTILGHKPHARPDDGPGARRNVYGHTVVVRDEQANVLNAIVITK